MDFQYRGSTAPSKSEPSDANLRLGADSGPACRAHHSELSAEIYLTHSHTHTVKSGFELFRYDDWRVKDSFRFNQENNLWRRLCATQPLTHCLRLIHRLWVFTIKITTFFWRGGDHFNHWVSCCYFFFLLPQLLFIITRMQATPTRYCCPLALSTPAARSLTSDSKTWSPQGRRSRVEVFLCTWS